MLPVRALLDLFDKLRTHPLGATSHNAARFCSQIQPFHQVVYAAGCRILEPAVEVRRTDEPFEVRTCDGTPIDYRNGLNTGVFEQ